MRVRNYSKRTQKAYVGWVRRFVRYCGMRHPRELGKPDIERFIEYLATERDVAASTQNQAIAALLFLYRHVLGVEIESDVSVIRAKRRKRIPTVLGPDEVARILARLDGDLQLIVMLLYGSGLRLNEALQLRIKDVDLARRIVTVRDGKGGKDRRTVFPEQAMLRMSDWRWAWVFPAARQYRDRESGQMMRYHVYETTVQRAITNAANLAEIPKRVTAHTFRHSFATQLLRAGYDIRTVQSLLGHRDVSTTMLYLHVLESGTGVRSPLDALDVLVAAAGGPVRASGPGPAPGSAPRSAPSPISVDVALPSPVPPAPVLSAETGTATPFTRPHVPRNLRR